ncbi:hypothetical protein B0H13DRAFT_2365872 [Mycena leptocephala]|nr:hypothetical protein B0H13DRAFT_2365872 [Mycena leptocephala]
MHATAIAVATAPEHRLNVEDEAAGISSSTRDRTRWATYSSCLPSSSESTSAESSYTGPVPSVGSTSCTPSESPSVSLSVSSTSASSTSTTKKTARSETERRLTLETDKCALRVTPHEVDCRGCRHTIKLDRRSRYYPGLWEKHCNQCKAISKLREAENVPGEPIPFDAELPESSSSGSDPTLLAPRKSSSSDPRHFVTSLRSKKVHTRFSISDVRLGLKSRFRAKTYTIFAMRCLVKAARAAEDDLQAAKKAFADAQAHLELKRAESKGNTSGRVLAPRVRKSPATKSDTFLIILPDTNDS